MAEDNQRPDDTFARESFTFRRMTQGQLWAITVVAAAVVIGLLIYGAM